METPSQRFRTLSYDELTLEQRAVANAILNGPRKSASLTLGGPFQPLLRSPGLAGPAQEVGAYLRFQSSLPRRLNEMAILMTARRWTAHYEWFVHKTLAIREGLDSSWANLIALGERPADLDPDAAAVFEFVSQLLEIGAVSDDAYADIIERFEERGVVDLIGVVGYYCMISFVLNVDRCPLPEGAESLKPLRGPH